jgi:xanthosine utilization system XapX-like protein
MASTFAARSRAVGELFRYSPIVLFIAGALSVLVFQMGTIAILHALGYAGPPFGYAPTKPMGIPQTWSFAFWGGVWGIVYGLLEQRFPKGPLYYAAAFLFGAILPVAVLWFVVFPLKGLPVAAGWNPSRMIPQVIFHGMFGLGIALLLKWASLATLRSGPPER